MEFSTAIRLIEKGILTSEYPQHWAELGAGDGFFTRALASVIPAGSSILAVDKNASSLRKLLSASEGVKLATHASDFTILDWGEGFDGILMANALHYVQDQVGFLSKLKGKISRTGRVLVVEYERKEPNPWVPYPVAMEKLREVGASSGFSSVEKLEQTTSIYDNGMIYSACLIP